MAIDARSLDPPPDGDASASVPCCRRPVFAQPSAPNVQKREVTFGGGEFLDEEVRGSGGPADLVELCGQHLELVGQLLQPDIFHAQWQKRQAATTLLLQGNSGLQQILWEVSPPLHSNESEDCAPAVHFSHDPRDQGKDSSSCTGSEESLSNTGIKRSQTPNALKTGRTHDSLDGGLRSHTASANFLSKRSADEFERSKRLQGLQRDISQVYSIEEIEDQCKKRPGVKFDKMPTLKGIGNWLLFRSACKRMVESTVFEWVVTTAISVNAVCFGIQADWSVKNPGEAPPYEFEVIEYSLMAFFTFELFLRLLPNGAWLLNPKNPDLYWNMLDVFLVITSFLEFTARHFGVAVVKTNITRLCRLGRIVRAVRIIRIIRFFAELRVMVLAIGSSLRLLLWASCLLIMLMYLFAVSFLQIVEEEFQVARDFPERAHPRIDELKKHWGSLLSGVYTLYLSITNGISWHMAADPLMELSPLPLALYCAYIAVAVFCVLNTVTGIFVEKANHIAKVDEDCRLWAELDKRKKWVREVKTLFKRADSKGEGFLDYQAFALQLQDVRVQEHLKALGLDVMTTDIQTLFELFDFDGGGTIEINEFATALQRLNGGASAVDVASMKFALKVANQHIVDIIGAMESMGFKVPRSHFGSNTLSRIGFDDNEADSE